MSYVKVDLPRSLRVLGPHPPPLPPSQYPHSDRQRHTAKMSRTHQNVGLILLIALTLLASPAAAFGAGNIASISKIEGHNWRHGDIEDLLKTVPFLTHHKWTSLMIKRAYFGNWFDDVLVHYMCFYLLLTR